ncbi:hypothetical protein TNCV_393401 [Trichonephila clavipes]|nr:hypothetical protein TNCV_393401 [Trichonephila clavipes]
MACHSPQSVGCLLNIKEVVPPCCKGSSLSGKRYQANSSHCEVMAVVTCSKPIPEVNLVSRPKQTNSGSQPSLQT